MCSEKAFIGWTWAVCVRKSRRQHADTVMATSQLFYSTQTSCKRFRVHMCGALRAGSTLRAELLNRSFLCVLSGSLWHVEHLKDNIQRLNMGHIELFGVKRLKLCAMYIRAIYILVALKATTWFGSDVWPRGWFVALLKVVVPSRVPWNLVQYEVQHGAEWKPCVYCLVSKHTAGSSTHTFPHHLMRVLGSHRHRRVCALCILGPQIYISLSCWVCPRQATVPDPGCQI